MPNIYEKIGRQIREERKARVLSLEELAEKADLTPSFLGQIERGERKLSVATLEKLAIALHVSPCNLMKTETKKGFSWEDRIADLLRHQPLKHKVVVFKTLKYLFRILRGF
ncbi:MAG: hypothetical protein A3G41_08620 [Elusimicrobia bacterium RIFCSPLOWO2_12_FULL_59_9]|nr:MAG: hypothetical protein A3G41_08620 [Elusimicrobia bacterium RIFCSPLOWO2_12_FULL_59_9]